MVMFANILKVIGIASDPIHIPVIKSGEAATLLGRSQLPESPAPKLREHPHVFTVLMLSVLTP